MIAAPSAPVMGLRNAFGMDKVGMSMGVSVQFDSAQANLNDTFVLSMAMEKVELDAAVNLAMSEPAALNLRLDQFSSVDCIFSTIRNTSAMTALTLVLGSMRLGIDCSCEEKCACSSPLMAALSADLASPNGTAQLLSFAQEGLSGLTKRLLNPSKDFAKAMDEELRKATTRCHAPPKVDHGDGPPPDVLAMQKAFRGILVATLITLFLTMLLVVVIVYKLRTRKDKPADEETSEILETVAVWPSKLKGAANSLVQHPAVHPVARVLIPVLLLANISMLAYSQTVVGCSIDLEMHLVGDTIRVEQLFPFSLVESVVLMWKVRFSGSGCGCTIALVCYSMLVTITSTPMDVQAC